MSRRALPSPAEALAILRGARPRPPRRPPPPAGRALAPYLKQLEGRFGSAPHALLAHWPEIVGETLARRTEPVKLIRGRSGQPASLEVRVDGPAAALIQHQGPDILARVNLHLGQGAVAKLRIVQGPVRRLAKPAASRNTRQPLDAAQEQRLAASLADVPDGPLKAALERLGRGVIRRSPDPQA